MPEPYSPHEFTALVCLETPELLQAVSEQLTALGFAIETAQTPAAAVTALHTLVCDIVITSDDFGGADAFTNPVLAEINEFSQEARRAMFVTLIGQERTTQAEMEAFALSVDLVLNPQDIPRLKGLVGQNLARKEAFYRVFHLVEKAQEAEIG